MEASGWYTLAIVAVMILALAREIAGPDLIMMGGLFALAATGILTPEETFAGFANPAVASIGALFIVSAGLRETGLLEALAVRLFGSARHATSALLRMCPPMALFSAFLNNAPIVAMMTPVVIDWADKNGRSASRLLIPLSYATVLGSVGTVIGTSVNLMVSGLLVDNGMAPMAFFELLPVGLPIALIGLAYIIFVAPRWLPSRRETREELGDRRREYTAAMRVDPGCRLIGQTVEQAGLRHLTGLFLVEIERGGQTITPVGPDQWIETGDRLVFAGVVSTIVDLQRIPGLVADSEGVDSPGHDPDRRLMEAVVSSSSPLVGRSIRDAAFRTTYDAAVVAVHRNGDRVSGKIGEIVLRPGDTLLLQTAPGFLRAHRNSPDFYLVSELGSGAGPRTDKGWIAVVILVAMVVVAAVGWMPISIAAFLAAGALVATRCINGTIARQSVAWSVLVVIGAGFGIALAIHKTGAAHFVAEGLVAAAGGMGPLGTLAAVYATTVLLSELLHHNASAAIMLPISIAAANEIGAEPRTFVMAVAMAASCAFANPVTYQAHLIVYGPGGYRFGDFVRVGLPLDLLAGAVAVTALPMVFGI